MKALPNALARALRGFFANHLPGVRGASPNTIESYRDSLALLLRFVASRSRRSVARLDLEAFSAQEVIDFLHHLEADRQNVAATRNVRLAAVHAFFRYLATEHPERLDHCQRILAVPFKRARPRVVEYLEYEEIEAVLAAVDRTSRNGRRDYALLATMFNTGVRVQEILGLRACDIRFERPAQIRVLGKGRRERLCPLWAQTAEILRAQLLEDGIDPPSTNPVFRNHRGEPLTRFGVRYILRKHCEQARTTAPTLAHKRLHPHSMRHSTAVHLLRSGVDMVTISHWLGHASVTTTNRYVAVDLETKRKAIEKARPTSHPTSGAAAWRADASILEWLEAL
jgi:site-specific recombinase XerD